jgi:hypothetical protein
MPAPAPNRAVRLFGTTVPEPASRLLTAGPLTAELDAGALRTICLGGVEVIRAIAFLVRDESWGTRPPTISRLRVREDADGFSVTYEARFGEAGKQLLTRATITGRPDGSLDFDADSRAEGEVLTNRTGFIVLHPLRGVAGERLTVEHVDGSVVEDRFPAIVSPLQPFYEIRALTHEALPGVKVTCRMEGDTFEMEDHRNWTDASYKTYVRPLALPWPYSIAAGTSFRQSVSLRCAGKLPRPAKAGAARRVTVEVGGPTRAAMPQIGLGLPATEGDPSLAVAELVAAVGPQLLLAQIDLTAGHGTPEVERARALGEATGAAVALEIVIPGRRAPKDELARISRTIARSGLMPAAVTIWAAADRKGVLPGSQGPKLPAPEEIYAAAREAFPDVPLGGGHYAFFTELNRKRPQAELLDFVTHTTCGIVHAADDRSVMETLEALPYVVRSARAFIGKAGYRVGPSAIGARDNPYGAAPAANPGNGRVPLAAMDPRQRGLFGAAWTLGYVAALARGGVDVVTLGAPTGPHGLVARRAAWKQPYFDRARKPAIYPVYHVVAGLAAAAGAKQIKTESSDPSAIAAIAWRRRGGLSLWLANLTGTEQRVALAGLPDGPAILRRLDEDSFVEATGDPAAFRAGGRRLAKVGSLTLGAYAVAALELGA